MIRITFSCQGCSKQIQVEKETLPLEILLDNPLCPIAGDTMTMALVEEILEEEPSK